MQFWSDCGLLCAASLIVPCIQGGAALVYTSNGRNRTANGDPSRRTGHARSVGVFDRASYRAELVRECALDVSTRLSMPLATANSGLRRALSLLRQCLDS